MAHVFKHITKGASYYGHTDASGDFEFVKRFGVICCGSGDDHSLTDKERKLVAEHDPATGDLWLPEGPLSTKMTNYLIHFNGVGSYIEIDAGKTTSFQFGEIQRKFATLVSPNTDDYARLFKLDESYQGVYYEWSLAGPDGAWFTLIKLPQNTADDIQRAKDHLYRSRDVVKMNVLRINKLIEFTHTS
jgi:hypothetical protein